jgi:hypothetical protein
VNTLRKTRVSSEFPKGISEQIVDINAAKAIDFAALRKSFLNEEGCIIRGTL